MCYKTEFAPAATAAATAVPLQSQGRCGRMSAHRRFAFADSYFITTVRNKTITFASTDERKSWPSAGYAKSLQKVHPEKKKTERSARDDGGDEVSDESHYPLPEPLRRRSKTEEEKKDHQQRNLPAPDDPLAGFKHQKKTRRKTATNKKKEKCAAAAVSKSVRFSNVHIREYSVVIGDSPSCNTGIPISLGWDYSPSSLSSWSSVDEYERIREPVRHTASGNIAAMELELGRRRRMEILANVGGYDYKDLVRKERRLRMEERDVFFGRKDASILEGRVGA